MSKLESVEKDISNGMDPETIKKALEARSNGIKIFSEIVKESEIAQEKDPSFTKKDCVVRVTATASFVYLRMLEVLVESMGRDFAMQILETDIGLFKSLLK